MFHSKHCQSAVRREQSELDDGDGVEGPDILHSPQGEPGLTLGIEFQDPVVSVFITVLASRHVDSVVD